MVTDHKDIGVGLVAVIGIGVTLAVVVVDLIRAVGLRHEVALDLTVRAIRSQPDMYVAADRHNHAVLDVVTVRIAAAAINVDDLVICRLGRLTAWSDGNG